MKRRHWTRSATLTVVAIATALVMVAPVGAQSGSGGSGKAERVHKKSGVPMALIEQAKAEGGKLSLLWDTPGTKEEVAAWSALFRKMYGFAPQVTVTPSSNMPANAAALIQEFKANRNTQQDVFLGTETHFIDLNRENVLMTLDPAQLPNLKGYLQASGTALPQVSRMPGFTYNSNIIAEKDVPKSVAELAAKAGQFNVATTPFPSGWPTLAAKDFGGKDNALALVRQFGRGVKGQIPCGTATQRLGTGEFDLFAIDCGHTEAILGQKNGAPLKHVIPTDLGVIAYWYAGVPKNATNPATAQLWVNMLATRKAQDAWYKYDFTDWHLFPGSKAKKSTIDPWEKANKKKLVVTDISWAVNNPEPFDAAFRGQVSAAMRGQG